MRDKVARLGQDPRTGEKKSLAQEGVLHSIPVQN